MTSATALPLTIDIVSDSICPFCYIGWRKISAALASSPHLLSSTGSGDSNKPATFAPQIRFRPFQLDATLPKDAPLDKREHYFRKFGPRFAQMEPMMKQRGQEVGIDFVYDGPLRNTTPSHRLMEKAFQTHGSEGQRKLLDQIFPAYFEKSQDIGDPDTLAQLAFQAGLFDSASAAKAFVASDELADEVERGYAEARSKSISGVPHFTITAMRPDGDSSDSAYRPFLRSQVSGAQDPGTFLGIFESMAQKAAEKGLTGGDTAAVTSSVDGNGSSCAA
ncbi:unnamed protein product [Tilletia controversa]|uniref:DSBA-like thioredoxin domain-containing protein n=3 Tax=Tilletia TaxID=13289 RepID=A0A8X7SVU1_9BASI|nr:hypothetical protein CF328_g5303 [Tilletia controversa]KAE8193136.1 hypothetical protein CF336_g4125 [Tilletia laevis]KAE8256797.1 hypothetical protein A4X03_0g5047 [Tilletia caries]KAE8197516.1 hypothetical protein CF335_g4595 [Tilletia laevis]KAE8245182.1 hypothetical protein A4X06_0g5791 [Tilletia controversa]